METTDRSIFDYLTTLTGDENYYLSCLNQIESVNLDFFNELDTKFSFDKLKSYLDCDSWRHQLIALITIVRAKKQEVSIDLKQKFEKGGFISPQLMAGIVALAEPRAEAKYISSLLDRVSTFSSKQMGVIYAAAPHCGLYEAECSTLTINFDEFATGFQVTKAHINFWSKHEG